MNSFVHILSAVSVLFMRTNTAGLTYFSVTSSSYAGQIPNISPLRVIRLPFGICSRLCMLDNSCWSFYVYSATGTDNCVLTGMNLCRQPNLALNSSAFSTRWWEKVDDFSLPCVARDLTPIPTSLSTIPSTKSSTSSSTSATPPPKTCQECTTAKVGIPLAQMLDHINNFLCTLWPNGTGGPSLTLVCTELLKPVLLYRQVSVNTANVTEYVLTPEEMYWAHKSFGYSTFEVRFRSVKLGSNRASQYKNMSLSPAGHLTLNTFVCCPNDGDVFGVPLVNVPFVNQSLNPVCGPFWDLSTSKVSNTGPSPRNISCPGAGTGFYGQPGFYNGVWKSGITLATQPTDTILEIMVFLW